MIFDLVPRFVCGVATKMCRPGVGHANSRVHSDTQQTSRPTSDEGSEAIGPGVVDGRCMSL